MGEALRFFKEYEVWIYLLAGALAVWQIAQLVVAWRELQGATFGLERERAQYHLNGAAMILVMALLAIVVEFILTNFVVVSLPLKNPKVALTPGVTPTLEMATTPTPAGPPSLTVVATPVLTPFTTPITATGCVAGQVNIISPKNGETVSGIVTILGTVNIPNLGFYKYEAARPGDTTWLTLGGGRDAVIESKLGDWDTSSRTPGEYLLHLVVADNVGTYLPACEIRIAIAAPGGP